MNQRVPTTDDHLRRSVPHAHAHGTQTVYEIAEMMMLEECMLRCEALAGAVFESRCPHPILSRVSECISACEHYLAAKSRESCYRDRLADFCQEVLAATATACRELDHDAAVRCRMSCELAIGFLEQSSMMLAGRWN